MSDHILEEPVTVKELTEFIDKLRVELGRTQNRFPGIRQVYIRVHRMCARLRDGGIIPDSNRPTEGHPT